MCGTSLSCERDRKRERHRELRGLLLAFGASSELTEISSCFNNKERESSFLSDFERLRERQRDRERD